MTDITGTDKFAPRPIKFKSSLVRNVVISMLIMAILPALIIGLVVYFRTENILRQQTTSQLETLTSSLINQLNETANLHQVTLSDIQKYPDLPTTLPHLLVGETDSDYENYQTSFSNYLNEFTKTPSGRVFSIISIYDLSGNLLTSTHSYESQEFFTTQKIYKDLLKSTQSILVFNPGDLFAGQAVLVTTTTLMQDAQPAATIVGYSITDLPSSILQSVRTILPFSQPYLVFSDGSFISNYPGSTTLLLNILPTLQREMISSHVAESGTGRGFDYYNTANQSVFSYITQIPALDAAFVLEVPSDSVFNQVRSILPTLIILILIVLIISGIIISIFARNMVFPLVDLAKKAQNFSLGDRSFRARVNRKDEIGLLAFSFNKMVDELANYYHLLETRVEEKTHQLRTAIDIAQSAISTSNLNELLEKIPNLIVDKLGLSYAAFYLFDENQNKVILVSNASKDETIKRPELGIDLPINEDSLIGWSVVNKQSRISDELFQDQKITEFQGVIPFFKSQAAIPVISLNTVFGILDLQSETSGVFDQETISIFNSFANQIASGIRNSQVLEHTQLDLHETTSLYQVSRKMSQAQSIGEVEDGVLQFFNQLDLVSILLKCDQSQVKILTFTDPKGPMIEQALIGFNIPLAKGLQRLQDGNIVFLNDLKGASIYSNLSIYLEKRMCNSVALIPIFESGTLTHLLTIGSKSKESLSSLQVQPYRTLSEVIGNAFERINLVEQLNLRVQELSTIATVSESISSTTDFHSLITSLFEKLKSIIGDDIGFVAAINDSREEMISVPFYFDEEKTEIPDYRYSNDQISKILFTGKPVLVPDANAIGLYVVESPKQRLSTKSFMGIPLIVGGKTVGALALINRNVINRYSESTLDLLTALAPQIGTIVRNIQLNETQQSILNDFEKEKFLLESILKNIPDKIVIKDSEGKFIRISNSYADENKFDSPDNVIGQYDPEAASDGGQIQDPDLQVLNTGNAELDEIKETPLLTGGHRWSLTSKFPLNNQGGEIAGILKISRDVTDLVNTRMVAEQRLNQLLTTSDIAKEVTSGSKNLSETMTQIVSLLCNRFGYYHSSIFILDPIGKFLILKESTGSVGAKMKSDGYRFEVGSNSIVGQSAALQESLVVNDLYVENKYYPDPFLPETRSELAIPIKIGGNLLGVLDIHSKQINAFSVEETKILEITAEYLSIAIENEGLVVKTQKDLDRHRLLHQVAATSGRSITTEDAIRNAVQTIHLAMPNEQIAYVSVTPDGIGRLQTSSGYTSNEIVSLRDITADSVCFSVINSKKPLRINDANMIKTTKPLGPNAHSVLSVPVVYGDKLYGILNVENNNPGIFDDNDQEIMITLGNNLAATIANIELVDQINLQFERQRQLTEITGKIRRFTDVDKIMQTSLAEVCNVLNIRKATIQLNSHQDQDLLDQEMKGK